MKKIIVALLTVFIAISFASQAQLREAKIVYKHTIFWNKIYRELPYLSQEERDRELLAWGEVEGYTSNMNLYFTPEKSLYTYGEANEDQTYSWRKRDYIVYRDLGNQEILEYEETLGKTYLLKDKMKSPKWRIMNELKEIQGHLCMKAITRDTVKNIDIVAWFAADIPVSVGPERYYGLPGVILGMNYNEGDIIIEAASIEPGKYEDEMKLPRKMKGKEVNSKEMNDLLVEHFATMIKAQRNPYWAIRY